MPYDILTSYTTLLATMLYELLFIRRVDDQVQPIFKLCPDRGRNETTDLWTKHPVDKGLWKIIGRDDDHVGYTHGERLMLLDRSRRLKLTPR